MSREEVVKNLIEYAAKAFKCDASKIKEDTVIKDELGTNSMQRIAMSSLIENNMDVVIPIVEFGKYETIGALADKVMSEQ